MVYFKSLLVLFFGAMLAVVSTFHTPAMADDDLDSSLTVRKAELMAHQMLAQLVNEVSFPVEVAVVQRQDESPFVSVVSAQQVCLLVINTKPSAWKNWQVFREAAGMNEMDSFRFASLHELGHCQNRLGRATGEAVIPPGASSELNSDVYAVRKIEQLYGQERSRNIALQVIKGRKLYSGWSRTYDIASRLQVELHDLITFKTASAS